MATKNYFLFKFFCVYFFLMLNLHRFLKIKSHKEVTRQWGPGPPPPPPVRFHTQCCESGSDRIRIFVISTEFRSEIKLNDNSSHRHSIKLYILFPSFKIFSIYINPKMKLHFFLKNLLIFHFYFIFLKKFCQIWLGSGCGYGSGSGTFPTSDLDLE